MAKLDTRAIAQSIPEEWLKSDESVTLPDWGESSDLHEWQVIVAFLQNC